MMRILFLSPYVPSRIRVRPFNWLRTLGRRGHQVTLAALQPPGDDAGSLDGLREVCTAVHVVPHARWRTLWNGLRALPTGQPLQMAYSRSPKAARLVRCLQAEQRFDVVHVEHLRGAVLSEAVRSGTPIVYDAVDSISLLLERVLESPPTLKSRLMAMLDLGRTRRFEARLGERFDRVVVTSQVDRDALIALTGNGVDGRRYVVLPNGVDLEYFYHTQPHDHEPATLILTGKMSYHANVAAALDLAQKVMPRVWQEAPRTKLWVVGKNPPRVVQALGTDPRVTVTGAVPDIRPYLGRATVAVSPIRYGAGIQNKLLEAMAMGTPVVCTPQACSALAVQPGQELLIGHTADALARQAFSLLGQAERRAELSRAGRRFVETHHSWEAMTARLEQVYGSALEAGGG